MCLHDEMDCLQVHSGEENLEVKEEICESRMQGHKMDQIVDSSRRGERSFTLIGGR